MNQQLTITPKKRAVWHSYKILLKFYDPKHLREIFPHCELNTNNAVTLTIFIESLRLSALLMSELQLLKKEDYDTKHANLLDCSLKVRNLADELADVEINQTDTSETKKEYFLKIADQLQVDGKPKEKISKFTLLIIEERLYLKLQKKGYPKEQCKLSVSTVRHLRRVMKEAGYTDTFYARNTKITNKIDSNRPKTIYDVENQSWITQINLIEKFCYNFKTFLKHNKFDSMIPDNEKRETLQIFNALIEDSLECINNKTKVQKYHQYLLYEVYCITNMSGIAKIYADKFKKIETIHSKTIKKILSGRFSKLLDLFNPKTIYEATKFGFSGISCVHCDSLRTVFDDLNGITKIYCYSCRKHSRRPQTKLPEPNMIAGKYRDTQT